MIDSATEIINKAASNSLFMFCFCNLIIFFILVASSNPGTKSKSVPVSKPILQPGQVCRSTYSSTPSFRDKRLESDISPSFCRGPNDLGMKTGLITDSSLSSIPSSRAKANPPSSKPGSDTASNVALQLEARKWLADVVENGAKGGQGTGEKRPMMKTGEPTNAAVEEEGSKGEENELEILRRRVEDFIHKVNSQWKSENVKICRF